MKCRAAVLLVALQCARAVAADDPRPFIVPRESGVPANAGLSPALLPDSIVERAVRQTLAESHTRTTDAMGVSKPAAFSRMFDDARMPGCLKPNGLKWQPAVLGPFTVHGIKAGFPFLIVARLRGKCS